MRLIVSILGYVIAAYLAIGVVFAIVSFFLMVIYSHGTWHSYLSGAAVAGLVWPVALGDLLGWW